MKILCIGDSITFGEGIDPWNRWTSIVDRALHDHEVINKGVCGDTTRLGLERFPEDVQRQQPDVLIIQFSLNDANRWDTDCGMPRVHPEAFEANLKEMALRAKHFGAERVGIILPTPCTKESVAPHINWYASRIKNACLGSSASVIDTGMGRASGVRPEDVLQDDGVHLNEMGNQKIAEAVLAWLTPVLTPMQAVAA